MMGEAVSTGSIKTEVENLLIISYLRNELKGKLAYFTIKRLFDIFLSLILIILLIPLLLLISFLILLSPGKGIVFSQSRYGLDKRRFKFYKFRSMDQTNRCFSLCFVDGNGILNKSVDDPRITRIGKIIRKTSLDELPQLFNILKGDMSFVGPRPVLEAMVENYPVINKLRTLVKPGLTGLWQVTNRENHSSVADMMKYDVQYIRNCSLRLDIIILIKTIPAVLSCKGAV